MSAKEMWLSQKKIIEYKENKHFIEIYEENNDFEDGKRLFITFGKDNKFVFINPFLVDNENNTYDTLLEIKDIECINKQIEELGWNI